MSITLNGTTGIAGVDGTAAAPSVQGADSNTGVFFPAADTVAVTTGGSERLRVNSSGNVGIGTASPTAKLSVDGNIAMPAATTEDRLIEIGGGRTGNANSYIDFVGDATYTDYGLRIIRVAGGANAASQMAHRGTGNLNIIAQEAAPIIFSTTNTERMRIDASGRVTTPYQPAFIAAGLAAQTTYTANQVIVFNTAPLNIGSGYSTSTGRFTAPVAGTYAFTFQVYLNPGNANAPIAFYKNGTMEIFFLQGVGLAGIGLSTIISLAASDYVEVRVRNVAGASATVFNGADHTQFTGYLIG